MFANIQTARFIHDAGTIDPLKAGGTEKEDPDVASHEETLGSPRLLDYLPHPEPSFSLQALGSSTAQRSSAQNLALGRLPPALRAAATLPGCLTGILPFPRCTVQPTVVGLPNKPLKLSRRGTQCFVAGLPEGLRLVLRGQAGVARSLATVR